ncbi:16S rRNA (uracil(1498)-N(3))-methyltransferase [Trichococcus sp. K1Tr]|uniref:16S rRNA (uracil(1498)-N(3))-methyltransferase n=1 Tax=Trichococcus sp. K1Tr TaxID=3020847 RepID=UPI0023309A35|nr:16S rRNA (uracil(1498)-N(3))-methyltransferase [Trichococcus sp. K1Tr]MDB6352032.1 16S rRNA (uracil(1498)-N(3))-methyltransferase [Trichococcus sp. K1Tr]
MQRYIIPPLAKDYQTQPIILSDDFHHHMVHVMRMKQGEQVYLADNSGISFVAEITDISASTVGLKWVADEDRSTELPVKITIACGLPKGDKLEYIVQKGTELGAAAFIPFAAKNAVVKWTPDKSAKKQQRLQKIAKEAAEQSHRQKEPFVHPVHNLKELLAEAAKYSKVLIAYEEDAKAGEGSILVNTLENLEPGDSLLFVFGPEGGLAPEELAAFRQAGHQSCALGPRILRAETAPLYALAAVSYEIELRKGADKNG